MAEFDWQALQDDIEPIIAEFGQTATLTQNGPNTGTDFEPVYGDPDEIPIKLVMSQIDERNADGTLTGRVIEEAVISTSAGVTPARNDKVTLANGVDYTLTSSKEVNPAGTVLLWIATLKRIT